MLFGVLPAIAQDVTIPVGDIPGGQSVTITYEVQVNEDLPQGLRFIDNQGLVTGDNIDPLLSDDPDTAQASDSTRTQVGFTLDVIELPRTGENPLWRIAFLSFVIALAGTLLIGGAHRLLRR
jgi:hypothetical protein